jgi:hypothetical protein
MLKLLARMRKMPDLARAFLRTQQAGHAEALADCQWPGEVATERTAAPCDTGSRCVAH